MTDGATHVTVGLTSEECVSDKDSDGPLGILGCSNVNITLVKLRDKLRTSLPALPENFQFITERGWPVLESQEEDVRMPYIMSEKLHIRIKAIYGKPRVGVKTVGGSSLGFVFVEFSASLHSLRNAIADQLGNFVDSFGETGRHYQFVDLNKWPISYSQEKYFRVLEVVRDSCVHIFCAGMPQLLGSVDAVDRLDTAFYASQRFDFLPDSSNRPRGVSRQLTFRKVKDVERVITRDEPVRNQVLISYVRAEAANHALKLKAELASHGYSVYLDVHEIQSGDDWQDALNSAVTTCQAFVPLVTSRYGETMWTNREVKLADVLSKPIIPVSFLNNWPPRCLAIQFATTQFIYWKPNCDVKLDTENENLDISQWREDDVTAVVRQLASRLKPDELEFPADSAASYLKKNATLRSCPAKLPLGFQLLSQNREGRPLIVVSVHPKQKEFALGMRNFLEEAGYEVWCSIQDQLDHDLETQALTQEGHGLFFERSMSESSGVLGWSQCSQTSEDLEGNLKFQEKANEAGVIIVVLSKASAQSKRCKQQVFYCEHRKKIIPVKYEDFCMPGWMSNLIGTGVLQNAHSANFEELLKLRIKQSLNDELDDDTEKQRAKISAAATILKRQMPSAMYVYISGGTKFYHKDTENICKALGTALAKLDCVHIVTGGFNGVGATVSQSYDTARTKMEKPCNLWHILPLKDDQDRSHQGPQDKNGNFRCAPCGKTLFSGDSVRERESIVSQVFNICVLIEGGPGAAHEAEEFVWNDGIVIPVECTGGAASGKFNVPEQIFEIPVGVPVQDWYNLRNLIVGSKALAESICNIVDVLSKRMKQCRTTLFRSQSCPSPDHSQEREVKVKVEPDSSESLDSVLSNRVRISQSQSGVRKTGFATSRQATLDVNFIDSDSSTGFDVTDNDRGENQQDLKTSPVEQDKEWFTKLKNDSASKQQVKNELPKKRKKMNAPPLPRLNSSGQKTTPVKLNNTKTLPARFLHKNGSTKRTRQNVKCSAEILSSQQNILQPPKKPREN